MGKEGINGEGGNQWGRSDTRLKCVDYDTVYSGSHLSTPNAQAYSSGNDGQREAAQADQDAYP